MADSEGAADADPTAAGGGKHGEDWPKRAFVDTNLFLRFITNDVPEQADAVERILRRAAGGKLVLVTTELVIAEIVWTLESYYGLQKADIRLKVLAILNTPGIEVRHAETVLQAVTWYEEKNIDFIDAYHAAQLTTDGPPVVYTFDRKHFSRIDGLDVRVP